MEMVAARDFRTSPKRVWERLDDAGLLVVTNNGKPSAVLVDVKKGGLDETLASIRQAGVMRAVCRMQARSLVNGNSTMTQTEINAEITRARRAKHHD